MPFVTPDTLGEYDVIVVGSGAAGGQTAYTLAMEGARVLMLEAGRKYVPESETPMFQTPGQAPLRGTSTTDKPFGFYDATVDGGWQVPGEPYVNTRETTAGRFDWWRARMLGGRTNHWGRYSFRNGPYDFKPRSRDGLGFDWPISYEELAPYYDKVEMLIGVYGANDGLENTPNSPPGCLLPPPKPRVSDLLVAERAKRLGIPVVAGHRAVLTRALDHRTLPAKLHPGNPNAQKILASHMQTRAACFWATPCGRGCSIRANYQSTTVHLPPALATGKLDILVNAMVREVTLGKDGRASGVAFVDRTSGQDGRGQGARRLPRRERLRDRAHPAQLEVRATSAGTRQFERQARPLSHGHGRQHRVRPDSAAREPAAAQRGWRERRTHVRALVALQGATRRQARFRARLSHRIWRRPPHAVARARSPASNGSPAAATDASSRKTRAATTVRSSTSTAAAR